MPNQFGTAGQASPLPPAGWYPDPQGSSQRYWDGSRWTEQRMPAEPTRKRVPWWLVILVLIVVLLLFIGFFIFGGKIFRGSPSAPAPATSRFSAPAAPGASAAPAAPAPPGSISHTPGSVRVFIDGQEKSVPGTLWCATRPDGKLAIGTDKTFENFAVVLTPGTPLVVDSVVFPQGPPSNPSGGLAGLGMLFDAKGPGPGQASAVKDGNSYTIKGTAADAASAYTTTRPFEIDATCPS